MRISIRKSENKDIEALLKIYDGARRFMRANGNLSQWNDNYPSRETIIADIEQETGYVGVEESGEIVMAFALIVGEDPTYKVIEDGQWLNNERYSTIHRIASSGKRGGMLRRAVEFAQNKTINVRLDTHADNLPMQRAAQELGFLRCGIIYCRDGSPRIAFQLSNRL